ncbi:16457_t:CDS:2, partial [Gigaspora margarita]
MSANNMDNKEPISVSSSEIASASDLRPGFDIPSSKTLTERIFNKQLVQILEHNPDIISNNKVYIILNRGAFYDNGFYNYDFMPIKESIIQLESQDSTLAD